MKKFFILLIVAAILFSFGGSTLSADLTAEAAPAAENLYVYNWAEYIDTDLLGEFEQYYLATTGKQIRVEYQLFETNEELVTKLTSGNDRIDVSCPSEYAIQKLLTEGTLRTVDKTKIPNFQYIEPSILHNIEESFGNLTIGIQSYDMNDYLVPYMMGTLGILYNTAYVTEEEVAEAGWGILWNSIGKEELNGKILMKDSVRDAYVAVVLYAKELYAAYTEGKVFEDADIKKCVELFGAKGYDDLSVQELINCIDDDMLSIAETLLIAQKPSLKGYEVDVGKDDMIKGLAYVDLAWSGDAFYAIDEASYVDVELAYYVPEIGSNVWFDGWCIPKRCENYEAALAFIDFMCDPINALRNMIYIGYTSAVAREALTNPEYGFSEQVRELLEENEYDFDQYFEDDARYPPEEQYERLGVMKDFGAKNETLIAMWENVKSGSTQVLAIVFAVVIGVFGLAIGLYFLRERLKFRKRKYKKA